MNNVISFQEHRIKKENDVRNDEVLRTLEEYFKNDPNLYDDYLEIFEVIDAMEPSNNVVDLLEARKYLVSETEDR